MKILIISDILTLPATSGNRKIINSYVELFRSWGHEVHFLWVNKYSLRKNYRIQIKEAIIQTSTTWGHFFHQYDCSLWENIYTNMNIILCKLLHNGYRKCDDVYPEGLTKEIIRLHHIHHFDALLVNYFYLSKALEALSIKRKALFTHDSFSMYQKSKNHKAVFYLTKKEEQKALMRAPFIFAMQNIEAEYFKSLSPNSVVLINYSNCQYYIQPIAGNHNILYLAADTQINKQGLQWFINEVLPLIKKQFNDTKLLIAGGICNILTEYDNQKDIELIGKINDLAIFYEKGDVAINPCQLGTGLKIKTFEAVSYDKVTLVHPNGLIGIFDANNAPIFSSSNPLEWVEYLKKVWEENGFIARLKIKNRFYIQQMNDYIMQQYKIWLEE